MDPTIFTISFKIDVYPVQKQAVGIEMKRHCVPFSSCVYIKAGLDVTGQEESGCIVIITDVGSI